MKYTITVIKTKWPFGLVRVQTTAVVDDEEVDPYLLSRQEAVAEEENETEVHRVKWMNDLANHLADSTLVKRV